ncbi:methyl-accepting chemotaxis protein [Desulfonema ishimotonii]|uniref:Methyl-accepting chemotaxis protein n=1 Tax=Desulfonema ishimotonii TaxID=45657 RepID=A0A401FZH5_9BACT|nr:hypothetical protein [Desulfonema ishimotonii]GBC62360.1 methyl-accepting chemotaxis protein [Desulfonema ishimotonii]
MIKLRLKDCLLVSATFWIALGMTTLSLISYPESGKALVTSVTTQPEQRSGFMSKQISHWLDHRKLDSVSWGELDLYNTSFTDSFIGRAARKKADEDLNSLTRRYPYYENICIVNTREEPVAASNTDVIGKVNYGPISSGQRFTLWSHSQY